MADENESTPYDLARRMLEAFASVGVKTFDLTLTTRAGEKADFRRALTGDRLLHTFSGLLAIAEKRQQNVIVRPYGSGVELVQLDDLKSAASLTQVQPVAFLVLNTSPGNHQAWVAVKNPDDADLARRLKKGAGADLTASGATRVAGSINFKDKYAPDFPRVAIAHYALARIVTVEELTALKLVAPPEERPARVSRVSAGRAGGSRIWPDYQRCLEGAPRNHGDTGLDISRADFTWCRTALGWGFKVDEVAARLLQQSSKAKEAGQGERYAQLTAENAAASLKRETNAKPDFRPA